MQFFFFLIFYAIKVIIVHLYSQNMTKTVLTISFKSGLLLKSLFVGIDL